MAERFWQNDFSVKFPCKDCPDRHPACWSECERYKKAKEEHAEKVKQIERQKQHERDYHVAKRHKAPWRSTRDKITNNDKQW